MIYSLNRTVLKAIALLLFITIQYYKSFKNPANIEELNINEFRRHFIPRAFSLFNGPITSSHQIKSDQLLGQSYFAS